MRMGSVFVAKDRLKALLVADRIRCTPETAERLSHDIFYTVSKYMEVKPENIRIKITHSDIQIRFAGEDY